jgi:hypothetical protein
MWKKLKKCFKVPTSLQYTHLYLLEILYLNIKILTGRISWIVLYITSLDNFSINLGQYNTKTLCNLLLDNDKQAYMLLK